MRQSREFEICAGLRGTRYQTTQSLRARQDARI